jgi:hypothetical protein
MADTLMASIVQQALHGYDDGHRLIASSQPLTGADARIMLVMSDLSGPGVKPDPCGYLTGYPLEGSGRYVLARTWAAPEMPRPGCVWTHSLIIDNADLAAMASADGLLSAFRRPLVPIVRSQYFDPVSISISLQTSLFESHDRVREIINALYAAPDKSIVAEAEQEESDERLVMAIWMQQWPRLRRAFGFCTLAGMDRSAKGVPLDLQFVRSLDRQFREKFPNSVSPSEVMAQSVFQPLLADIEGRDYTKIREFLRRAGGDVDGGRRAMLPLCRLHLSLFTSERPDLSGAVDALESLALLGTQQARSVRLLVAKRAIERIEEVDDVVFDFVVNTLEQTVSASDQSADLHDRVGLALWRRSPSRFVEAIRVGGAVGRLSEGALSIIPANELVVGLRDYPQASEKISALRTDLLKRADFWSIPEIHDDLAKGVEAKDAGHVMLALLKAGRAGPAPFIIDRVEPGEFASALNEFSKDSVLIEWLNVLVRDPFKTASVLAAGKIAYRSILVRLARAGNPDLVPNGNGDDPWFIAIRVARKPAAQADEEYLAAFAMARALGSQSRSQAELIQFAYTTLYRALENRRLSLDAQNMIRMRLDFGWFGWDDCSRLRETVVGRFVGARLDPEIFGLLANDADLTFSLIDEAAETGRGRKYLREVIWRLKDRREKWVKARLNYIEQKIE